MSCSYVTASHFVFSCVFLPVGTPIFCQIEALSVDSLKQAAEEYREHFSRALGRAIQGTIKVSVVCKSGRSALGNGYVASGSRRGALLCFLSYRYWFVSSTRLDFGRHALFLGAEK